MDIYSTLLWHLRRNAALSFLAQELLNINSKSPEAWIAVGNCFSLQKEHSQALTCFQRASEMDPFCAYAYTLRGHESLVTDDVRKALIMFQMALGYDQRHYNAWYAFFGFSRANEDADRRTFGLLLGTGWVAAI
jgi:anaphase-promoting complex subunit 3